MILPVASSKSREVAASEGADDAMTGFSSLYESGPNGTPESRRSSDGGGRGLIDFRRIVWLGLGLGLWLGEMGCGLTTEGLAPAEYVAEVRDCICDGVPCDTGELSKL